MTFPEFMHAYLSNRDRLKDNAAWRAYDIEGSATARHAELALKALNFSYAGELALPDFCARYGVAAEVAPALLGAWWLFSQIDTGRPIRVGGRRIALKRDKAAQTPSQPHCVDP